jgi:hypothetical protein
MATKVRKQKQRPGPAARAPRERYPLAIVIDHATWRRWEQFKQEMGVTRDRTAFDRLLARAAAEGLFPAEE